MRQFIKGTGKPTAAHSMLNVSPTSISILVTGNLVILGDSVSIYNIEIRGF